MSLTSFLTLRENARVFKRADVIAICFPLFSTIAHNFIMSQDIPKTEYPSSETWDKMDKTDPYSMIMKVAALQAAAKVVMETPDLVAPKKPELIRNSNSPGPLARARIDEELGELKAKLEKTEADLAQAKSQKEYWYNAYVDRLKKEDEEMPSDQEQEENDRLWKRINPSGSYGCWT